MTSFITGRQAEVVAAQFLQKNKFKIVSQNWRTRYCEIDIVAQKGSIIYMIEVKYRKNDMYGSGVEAIGKKKLAQMQFAAELWVSSQNWQHDYRLAVIAVDQFGVTEFIDSVDL